MGVRVGVRVGVVLPITAVPKLPNHQHHLFLKRKETKREIWKRAVVCVCVCVYEGGGRTCPFIDIFLGRSVSSDRLTD